ncbi:MAG: hypothetical protein ACI33K_08170 [Clostridiaceae bacterium]
MPLSYNNSIIKSNISVKDGSRVIETLQEIKYLNKKVKEEHLNPLEDENLHRIRESILKEARERSEEIIRNAYSEAEAIKKNAYVTGYEEGEKNGYEDGYKEAYEGNIEKANKKAEEIITEGEKLLLTAKSVYEEYLRSKEKEILNLSLEIAQHLMRERLMEKDGLNNLIKEAIESSKTIKTLIIKANSFHCDVLEEEVRQNKQITLKTEVFVIPDNSLEIGNVEIITDKGKIKTGIKMLIDKIHEAF